MHHVPKPTTIAINTSLSSQTTGTHGTPGGGIDSCGLELVGLIMPAAWDAADITFADSDDGITFRPVFLPDNTELKITGPGAGEKIMLDSSQARNFRGLGRYIKVRSGTAAAAVNQTAERTVKLIFR